LAPLFSVQVAFTPVSYDTNSPSFHVTFSVTMSAEQISGFSCCAVQAFAFLGRFVPGQDRLLPIFKGQAVQEFFLDCLNLEDGKDRMPRNRGNHSNLRSVTSQYSEGLTSAVNMIWLFLILYVQIFSSALFLKCNQSSLIPEQVKL